MLCFSYDNAISAPFIRRSLSIYNSSQGCIAPRGGRVFHPSCRTAQWLTHTGRLHCARGLQNSSKLRKAKVVPFIATATPASFPALAVPLSRWQEIWGDVARESTCWTCTWKSSFRKWACSLSTEPCCALFSCGTWKHHHRAQRESLQRDRKRMLSSLLPIL